MSHIVGVKGDCYIHKNPLSSATSRNLQGYVLPHYVSVSQLGKNVLATILAACPRVTLKFGRK